MPEVEDLVKITYQLSDLTDIELFNQIDIQGQDELRAETKLISLCKLNFE